eukprot:363125-Chlamydomonas_euryale.AAC.4
MPACASPTTRSYAGCDAAAGATAACASAAAGPSARCPEAVASANASSSMRVRGVRRSDAYAGTQRSLRERRASRAPCARLRPQWRGRQSRIAWSHRVLLAINIVQEAVGHWQWCRQYN